VAAVAPRPARPLRELIGRVRLVAAEQLVATLAGEDDLHVSRGELGDEECRHRGGVGERLVARRDDPRQQLRDVRLNDELMVIGVVALRDLAGKIELVERTLLEPDREC
jgi:hypothetical protein